MIRTIARCCDQTTTLGSPNVFMPIETQRRSPSEDESSNGQAQRIAQHAIAFGQRNAVLQEICRVLRGIERVAHRTSICISYIHLERGLRSHARTLAVSRQFGANVQKQGMGAVRGLTSATTGVRGSGRLRRLALMQVCAGAESDGVFPVGSLVHVREISSPSTFWRCREPCRPGTCARFPRSSHAQRR